MARECFGTLGCQTPPGPPFFGSMGSAPNHSLPRSNAMHLLYLDSSGTPELTDKTSRHYVMAGLGMRDQTWFALNKRLRGLKRLYQLGDVSFELHVKQFAVSITEQDE